jgi:hypothetical protein
VARPGLGCDVQVRAAEERLFAVVVATVERVRQLTARCLLIEGTAFCSDCCGVPSPTGVDKLGLVLK